MNIGYVEIEAFIRSKAAWLQAQQYKMQLKAPHIIPEYRDGERHLFMGKEYSLRIKAGRFSLVYAEGNELYITKRSRSQVKSILLEWYRREAEKYFPERTLLLAKKYGFPDIKKITVRRMKARWGSCSSDAEIKYNIHLIKLSPKIIDSVILHELCHLIHHNHSRDFYHLLTHVNPEWREDKKSLQEASVQALLC